ncbi:protein ARV1 isoform X1 [Diorhabda sublineata]|uniref:protein ARV1 isoform X1 n=1 Tax=Diorhabda sublineata TaxID=1163346 RepID=UPI0024E06563|nr:protein ARV1 isoform X1 [Diorhabda sublineata]
MLNSDNKYCINCGNTVKSLYKEYSSTVLKLTECDNCKNIADKYVEYDAVIVIIDLILLQMTAYRHVLLNSEFRNFWKLSIGLIILETYMTWILSKEFPIERPIREIHNISTFNEADIYLDDIKFYEMSLNTILGFISYIIVTFSLTGIYSYLRKTDKISLITVSKAVCLSSSGIFLILPSLIWDTQINEFHILFVSLYTTLSQLLAHKAITNSEKIWSLVVVFLSNLVKMYIMSTPLTKIAVE